MLHNNSMTLIVHILIGLFHMILQYYTFSNRSISVVYTIYFKGYNVLYLGSCGKYYHGRY